VARARDLLVVRAEPGIPDTWLWEHTERVLGLVRMIAALPDFGEDKPDETVVSVAALYHDIGWAVQFREGLVQRWNLLSRPTSEAQRELAAVALQQSAGDLLDDSVLQAAAAAIRECNNRYTSLPEAQALAEAENLEEVGVSYLLRQLRQSYTNGRAIRQLIQGWTRQLEYKFWDARINDCLRFETTRRLAHARLADVGSFMKALARDCDGEDLRAMLRQLRIDPPTSLT